MKQWLRTTARPAHGADLASIRVGPRPQAPSGGPATSCRIPCATRRVGCTHPRCGSALAHTLRGGARPRQQRTRPTVEVASTEFEHRVRPRSVQVQRQGHVRIRELRLPLPERSHQGSVGEGASLAGQRCPTEVAVGPTQMDRVAAQLPSVVVRFSAEAEQVPGRVLRVPRGRCRQPDEQGDRRGCARSPSRSRQGAGRGAVGAEDPERTAPSDADVEECAQPTSARHRPHQRW
jgi:hypothetical protein